MGDVVENIIGNVMLSSLVGMPSRIDDGTTTGITRPVQSITSAPFDGTLDGVRD